MNYGRGSRLRTCDTCPGGTNCAGDNLAPVLAEIYALHDGSIRDKFEILFALSDESELLLERYNSQVSRICWTKAALETIANILATCEYPQGDGDIFDENVSHILVRAVRAFANFPWYVSGLIGQAPDLYETVCYREEGNVFASQLSKRSFVKICKEVVYNERIEYK